MRQLEGPMIGAFIAFACVFLFAFVLAARRGVLPPPLARRMPPILRPPRHTVSDDARGVWVPMDSPLYAHVQMYSSDMPSVVVDGSEQRPTRAAAPAPLATQLRAERPPSARPGDTVNLTAPLTAPIVSPLAVPVAVPVVAVADEEIPVAPPPAAAPAARAAEPAPQDTTGARRARGPTDGAAASLLSNGGTCGGSESMAHVDEPAHPAASSDAPGHID
mmetsp:Transcript_27411/g.87144  ORF Transcript_27411/g.87144 Transcript_27411/m.87144 type:complete len:219 (-) Transcript_27411:655-1311(-)